MLDQLRLKSKENQREKEKDEEEKQKAREKTTYGTNHISYSVLSGVTDQI